MNLSVLLEQYQNSPRLFQLADRLSIAGSTPTLPEEEALKQKIFLKDLRGSSSEFVVSSIFAHPNCQNINHLGQSQDNKDQACAEPNI